MSEKTEKNQSNKTVSQTKRLILLDAHAILHRAYHALPDFVSSKGEPTGGLYGVSTMLLKIIADLKPDYIVACYDLPGPTYRHDVYKDYKAGRKKADPALVSQMKRSRDLFTVFGIPIYDKPGFEADDMLGTIVEKIKNSNAENDKDDSIGKNIDIIIASGDMDTLQLVDDKKVQVYTLKKGINDTILYDEDAVCDRFGFGPELLPDYKGLRGDPSDNIIGIAGIGEKTATILIKTFGTIEDIYKALAKERPSGSKKKNATAGYESFKDVGITDRIISLLNDGQEEAEFSKMLATIRRDAPIDFKLPEQTFRDALDVANVKAFFTELDFRTLGARLDQVIAGKVTGKTTTIVKDKENNTLSKKIDPLELEKTAIAVWLVKSDLTNPSLEDIYNFTGLTGEHEGDFEKAREIIFAELEKRQVKKVYDDIELPLIPVVEKMKKRGIRIDVEYLRSLSTEYHAESNKLEKKIWDIAGVEFNISSPKQLGEVLFDKLGLVVKNAKKTGGGARSTKESELAKIAEMADGGADTDPTGYAHIAKLILDYRELQKLLGTYIDTIPTQVDTDNRLHGTLVQAGTTTGRMSSINPNLQNIPIKTELGKRIRQAFVADRGNGGNFVLASFDYSQIELRVAAFLSGDKRLIEIFKNGGDVHSAVASAVFGVPEEKVDREMRRRAKVINFGVMYGMGVNALRANLGTDRASAQQFYNDYFKTFSGLAEYLDQVKAETARRGYTETFFGRRRYFEGITSKLPFIRAMAERMAINAPIQGTEADIIKLAMIEVNTYIEKEGLGADVFMLLQVHDELLFEICEGKVEAVAPKIKAIMENVIDPAKTKGVKCVAEYAVGNNWSEI
jgi:DNA polymerase-1